MGETTPNCRKPKRGGGGVLVSPPNRAPLGGATQVEIPSLEYWMSQGPTTPPKPGSDLRGFALRAGQGSQYVKMLESLQASSARAGPWFLWCMLPRDVRT